MKKLNPFFQMLFRNQIFIHFRAFSENNRLNPSKPKIIFNQTTLSLSSTASKKIPAN